MGRDSLFYGLAYRFGKPRWDTDQAQPEVEELARSLPAGRALDLGCGTGTNDVYLAQHGWEVIGVDFIPNAIEAARKKAQGASVDAKFVVGDVSRLRALGVAGPFDLVLDVGCYHAMPAGRREAYAVEVAAVTRPGADFYLSGIGQVPATWRLLGAKGVAGAEVRERFGQDFELRDEKPRRAGFTVYHLVRRDGAIEGS
jgi:SAM-dependent methyltransferase